MTKNSIYLYGKNSVLERLKAAPQSVKRVFLQDNFISPHITAILKSSGLPVKKVTEKELKKIKRAERLQGIVAEVEKYRYTEFKDLLNPEKEGISLIFLDNINDPHNLGSIMRITACFGDFAVVIPSHSACEVNETVLHVASGGENYIPVSKVTNLSTALRGAKKSGYWAVGAVICDGEDINSTSLPFPLALVLGSEGKGIRYGIEKQLDMKISLPMEGAPLSFNVAMSCAIFAHEIVQQRKNGKPV